MVKMVNLISLINEENDNLNQIEPGELFEQNSVSELQMHKILYILFGLFYKKFNKDLFSQANFEAWKQGPVEIDFRRSLEINKEANLDKFNISLNNEELTFIQKLIRKFLICYSPWSLVEITQASDAWMNNYDGKNNNHNKIAVEEIRRNFNFVVYE